MSYMNRGEGERHRLAAAALEAQRTNIVVPWPVYTEAHLLLSSRGFKPAAVALGRLLLGHELRLVALDRVEHSAALDLLRRYGDNGLDLPDASVMALVDRYQGVALTWDFRHFREVVFGRGKSIPLLVNESDLM